MCVLSYHTVCLSSRWLGAVLKHQSRPLWSRLLLATITPRGPCLTTNTANRILTACNFKTTADGVLGNGHSRLEDETKLTDLMLAW